MKDDDIDIGLKELTHGSKVVLFITDAMDKLIRDGLIEGPQKLSLSGADAISQLKAEGFTASNAEYRAAVTGLINAGVINADAKSAEVIKTLLLMRLEKK